MSINIQQDVVWFNISVKTETIKLSSGSNCEFLPSLLLQVSTNQKTEPGTCAAFPQGLQVLGVRVGGV